MGSFSTLHTLRCIGFADVERIATVADKDRARVESDLRTLAGLGLVESVDGPFGGWGVTDTGKAEDLNLVAAELDARGGRDAVERSYRRFLELNPRLLEACTDWQMATVGGTVVVNDHGDGGYDAAVIDRLVRLDRSAQSLIADLVLWLPRFDRYRLRLSAALERVLAGEHAAFADDLDSYHVVWFQIHEDLLVTLGMERGD
ncbi:MAG: transcriptional regulator [Acidimicrobiia bacterium]|nr:transcriptional regulator [Acidimicrobiia bacterium]